MIKLFDIQNGKVTPTEHCYTLNFLRCLMDGYPEDYLNIYAYLFYSTCPNPDLNPFFNIPEEDQEEIILNEVGGNFSIEDSSIVRAKQMCEKMFQTPTYRAYMGIRSALERIGKYMEKSDIIDGRDGNGMFILRAAKEFAAVRESYKNIYKDLQEEQESQVRGGQRLSYDS